MNKQDKKAEKLKRYTGKYLGKHNLLNISKILRKQVKSKIDWKKSEKDYELKL